MIKKVDFDTGTRELPEGVTREHFVAGRMGGMGQVQQQPIYQKWWFWAIVIVLVYAGWKGYKTYKRKKEQKEEKKHKK
jgi:threonine/homoserine/homoserine lactone efflux protein